MEAWLATEESRQAVAAGVDTQKEVRGCQHTHACSMLAC